MDDNPLPTRGAAPGGVSREELHHRRIDMRGYRRSDGLFEVESRLVDTKPYDFQPVAGVRVVRAHEPVHDMGVRITYDIDLVVRAIETFTNHSPYPACPDGGAGLQAMVGCSMTRGWTREVRERLGGDRACAHLRELLTPLATTAFQSLSIVRQNQSDRRGPDGRPVMLDSCHAYSAKGDIVLERWPQFYRGDKAGG